ncbi:S41 family peptidase [Halobacteriovorax sp. HLS]|uniref:S41 family peptidase n=1 Tax=Halobacteriovorax sp. HLS TaxID=2234000 RepID=UPI000FD8629D|nr:S41 family peptidase [Halobacteriovorax sp. HLS]
MTQIGYYKLPEIHNDKVYFVCDEDIWMTDRDNCSMASRLTSSPGISTHPKISPDGLKLAYLSNTSGENNVYLMNSQGGIASRITHFQNTNLLGWKDNKTLYVSSSHQHFTDREKLLYEVNTQDFTFKRVDIGPTSCITTSSEAEIVIGRHTGDPARWKRYRGGTAGTFWYKKSKKDHFKQILKNIKTNLANPLFIEKRLFFISDHEGHGNIYSMSPAGRSMKRHTNHEDYYVRSFSYSNGVISYCCGAEIYELNLETNISKKLTIEVNSQFLQSREKFISALDYLQDFDLTQDAQELLINSRGKLFFLPPWSGGPIRLGTEAARYKKSRIIWSDESEAVCAMKLDDENEEHLVTLDLTTKEETSLVTKQNWGKVFDIASNPKKAFVAISNNRNELFLVDIDKNKVSLIDKSENDHISNLKWSDDGRFLAYHKKENINDYIIKIYDMKEKKSHRTVNNVLTDYAPTFSKDSKTLFFIGAREFNPTGSEVLFQLGFPFLTKVYAMPLLEQNLSPHKDFMNFEISNEEEEDQKEINEEEIKIDWSTLHNRIEALPIEQGGLKDLFVHNDTLYIFKSTITPSDPNEMRWEEGKYNLLSFSFKDKKVETLLKDVNVDTYKKNGKYLLIETEEELRLIDLESKVSSGDDYCKKDGWIDLERIKIKLDPVAEWKQMYREAWILQREHFWTEDMSKIDWQSVYKKYHSLLPKVKCRSDLSDLIWEMQGELGTSHAYEFGGDYPNGPTSNPVGSLDAEFTFHPRTKSFEITKIYNGDSWVKGHDSPLSKAAVSLKVGDHIYSLDGEEFSDANSLQVLLENKASTEISLLVKRSNKRRKENISLIANKLSTHTRYRQWVEQNRSYVKQKSRGKLGYVHIPDMSLKGISEFWRSYSVEHECDGLVIDVRYNGGGSVSQLLLKELQQKVLAFNQSRWFGQFHYPVHSVNGPLVCITNEHAGSDGDIFSHCFKLLNLGKLIGKRTWGGVIGIWPRHYLNDFSLTSQPEFSFWFKDVGFDVENYGTDPNIEVDITPEQWGKGIDSQLDKAIEVILKDLKVRPPLKLNTKNRPILRAPKLPKL